MPNSPRDFLANWTASRGNLRNFLENQAFAPLDDEAQKAAGEAAASAAVDSIFGLDLKSYHSGVDSVQGSFESAGAKKITQPDPDIPQDSRRGRLLRRGQHAHSRLLARGLCLWFVPQALLQAAGDSADCVETAEIPRLRQ